MRPPQTGRIWLLAAVLLVAIIAFALFAYNTFIRPAQESFPNNDDTEHTGALTQNYQVGDHALIVIKGHGSDVNIHAGNDNTVTVKARKHGSSVGPDSNDTKILYKQGSDEQGHDQLTITSDPAFRDIDYDVTLPASARVQVEVDSGSIAAEGINGVTIDTGSGSLDVEDIQGPVDVHTESGDITARDIKGQVLLEAGSGSIRITRVHGQLKAITHSGDVIAREATLNGQSTLKTNSGSVRFEGAIDPQGTYKMETNSGDVDLTLPGNTAFQLNASTGSGSVHNDFGSDTVGSAPRAQVIVTIGSGSLTVNEAT